MNGKIISPSIIRPKIGRWAFLTPLLGIMLSCSGITSDNPDGTDNTIVRTYECFISPTTKTSLETDRSVTWNAGDKVLYYSINGGSVGTFTITEDTAKASMSLNIDLNATYLTAVYGAAEFSAYSQDTMTLSGVVKYEQLGTFADGHAAVAHITNVEETSLRFYNIVSFITFSTARKDAAYAIFTSNDETPIHSKGLVQVHYEDGVPVASLGSSSGNSIKINMTGAGQYLITTLATTLPNGFTLALYRSDDTLIGTATGSKVLSVKRSAILNLGKIDGRLVDENGITLNPFDGDDNWDNTGSTSGDIDFSQYGNDYNWDSDTNSDGNIDHGGYGNDCNWNSDGNGSGDVNHGGYGDDSDWDSNSGSGGDINKGGYGDDSNWN